MSNLDTVNRSLNWVSALNPENAERLNLLEDRMKDFYSNNASYYSNIEFTGSVWLQEQMLPQQDILKTFRRNMSVLEVGCGRAEILKASTSTKINYTGVDFSESVIKANKEKFPSQAFFNLTDPQKLPFADEQFDIVFSHFVIEHCVFPQLMLVEKLRVLKPGGILIILCPAFLENKSITSQRTGFSPGSGSLKLKRKQWFDAFVTFYDNKVRLPIYCRRLMKQIKEKPMFMINTTPRCFQDAFQPDVDAVYVTYAAEIKSYCKKTVNWLENDTTINEYCKHHHLIYLKGIKR